MQARAEPEGGRQRNHAEGRAQEGGSDRHSGPPSSRFERHARAWALPRLSQAVSRILDAELECKSTGMPDEAIARRLCLALAQAARQAHARR